MALFFSWNFKRFHMKILYFLFMIYYCNWIDISKFLMIFFIYHFRTRRLWQYKIGNGLSCSWLGRMCSWSRTLSRDDGRPGRERSSKTATVVTSTEFSQRAPAKRSRRIRTLGVIRFADFVIDSDELRCTEFRICYGTWYRKHATSSRW